jgi:hypothetical protein
MTKQHLGFLAAIFILCTPLSAQAQGYPTGIRTGTNGSTSSGSATSSTQTSTTSASRAPAGNRNMGTGQTQPEGALGMTPQLQKELGISRQQ